MLESCYRAVIETVRREVASAGTPLFIGGKSMGGRMATHVAAADAALPLAGLVLLGYPLHPPGRPAERRDKHLPAIRRPMLFVQGSRDTFGTPDELTPVLDRLEPQPTLHIVDGGDHSFKVARSRNQAEVFRDIQKRIADWIRSARTMVRTSYGETRLHRKALQQLTRLTVHVCVPLVAAFERNGKQFDARRSKPRLIVFPLCRRVPIVGRAPR